MAKNHKLTGISYDEYPYMIGNLLVIQMKPLYISYQTDDHEAFKKLKQQLEATESFTDNFSIIHRPDVSSMKKRQLKGEIKELIEKAHGIIFILGPETRESPWLDLEVKIAMKADKRGVIVHIPHSRPSYTIRLHGSKVPTIEWDLQKIIEKLNELFL